MAVNDNAKYQGLFGYNKGTIKNIGVDGNEIKLNKKTGVTAGVIAGYNEGLIESCYNKANITSENVDNLGGIAGIIKEGGKISKCYNTGNIKSTARTREGGNTGGICAAAYSNTIIESCYNEGVIYVETNYANCRVGGIVGQVIGVLRSCYNKGNITLKDISNQNLSYQAVGGIVGQSIYSEISYCYNKGNVILEGSDYLSRWGSILGGTWGESSVVLNNCYMVDNLNITCTYPGTSVERSGKYIEDATIITEEIKDTLYEKLGDCYVEDEKNINDGYPILNWQN